MALSFLHILGFYLIIVQPFGVAAAQTGNISLESSLTASDNSVSWQSPSGEFAFGFRRVGDQELFLLAIWYDKIPEKTIVWYANGDNPAPKGSKAELTKDGEFKLTGPRGEEIWPQPAVISGVAYADMLDSGNFVLADKKSDPLWQSFKDRRDTILPTQVLDIGDKLNSRQSASNYSKGKFQLQFRTAGTLELYTIALPTDYAYPQYFISETSNAANEMLSGHHLAFNESGRIGVVLRNGNIVTFSNSTASPSRDYYFRATLDWDGLFTQYAHPKSPKNGSWEPWFALWSIPSNICFSSIAGDLGGGPCGYNTYCRLDANTRPICECVPGFSPIDPNNKMWGCKQDRKHSCELLGDSKLEDVYVLHELANTFWPTSANYDVLQPFGEEECSRSCLEDCNCVVAVIFEGNCVKKKLPLSNGRQDWSKYGRALIKLPKTDAALENPASKESDVEKKDQKTVVLVGALLLGSSVFLNFLFGAAIALLLLYTYRKSHRVFSSTSSIMEANIRSFTYKELEEATDGFKEELGRGAFGTVYKGVISSLSSTNYVAIKKLDKVAQDGEKEFKTEASAIAKTHHKNLVRLLGLCDEGENKLLVYEFMSNGTLASFLFGISRPDWNKRIQIAFGIARGLMYLHDECSTQIIHCDIKPPNILLDDSFTARISDFGLAKLLRSDQSLTHTVIRGTRGYVAPEWFRNTPVTAKVDVYSYGVMLLEIICCRRSLEMERKNEEEVILTDWVYDCYKQRRLKELIEDDEEARNDMKRLERLVMVAIWCIQEDPSLRPTMKKVTQMLEGVVDVSVPPSPSPFSSIC